MKIFNYLKNNPIALLIFSLLTGAAYFCLLLAIFILPIVTITSQMLIVWYFSPVVICGIALVLIKTIKRLIENEQTRSVVTLVITHIGVIVLGIVFAIAIFKHIL